MGERNYIYLENDGIYLYSHWDTQKYLYQVVIDALKRGRERWDDSQYLNRIIFCELIKEDVLGLTNYGISKEIWDGQVAVTVDIKKQTVNGHKFSDAVKKPNEVI